MASPAGGRTYVITGPTAGLGRAVALAMARHGTLVLVGRDAGKLDCVKGAVERLGGRTVPVVCDLSDLGQVRAAAARIVALDLPIGGLLNNAGVQNPRVGKTAAGWDMTFATNHLGPFALTEALLPHLEDGANIVFVGSATEDPDRRPALRAGFRGGRYISAQASARGEWEPDGSSRPGMDAYATSKQCNIVTAMALAREHPRLSVNAVEPGIMFNTGLHAGMKGAFVALARGIVPLLAPFMNVLRTPRRAAGVIRGILIDPSGATGVYYDESGHPMPGSALLRVSAFQDRVVAETRALLAQPRTTGCRPRPAPGGSQCLTLGSCLTAGCERRSTGEALGDGDLPPVFWLPVTFSAVTALGVTISARADAPVHESRRAIAHIPTRAGGVAHGPSEAIAPRSIAQRTPVGHGAVGR